MRSTVCDQITLERKPDAQDGLEWRTWPVGVETGSLQSVQVNVSYACVRKDVCRAVYDTIGLEQCCSVPAGLGPCARDSNYRMIVRTPCPSSPSILPSCHPC